MPSHSSGNGSTNSRRLSRLTGYDAVVRSPPTGKFGASASESHSGCVHASVAFNHVHASTNQQTIAAPRSGTADIRQRVIDVIDHDALVAALDARPFFNLAYFDVTSCPFARG